MKKLALLFLLALGAFGQAATPMCSGGKCQFFDNSGRPLNGGKLYTYFAGTSTPLATYTDSTAGVPNPNPVIMDASGRASVWLGTQAYKFILTTSLGVTIWTTDNVPGNSSNFYVPITGGTVSGSLNVNNTLTATNLIVTGTCTGCGSGGGGGVALPFKSVQFNDSGAQAGSSNFAYDKVLQLLTVTAADSAHAGIAVATGFIQSDTGFLATPGTGTAWNTFYAPAGGMSALSFTAVKYMQVGNSNGVPVLTTGDSFNKGAIYYDTALSSFQGFNGSGWTTIGSGSGSPGAPANSVQVNVGGAFTGSANLTYSAGLLTATAASSGVASIAAATGFMQSDAGFVATSGTCLVFNCIQAPTGGTYALSHTSLNYTQLGNHSGAPTVTSGDTFHAGAAYFDTGSHALQIHDGSGWVAIAAGTGVPGAPSTSIQFNSGGAFAGSANLTYATQLLTSIAASSSVAGMAVQTGFMQADQGFVATSGTCVKFNCIQAPTGGTYALSHTSLNYTQLGNASTTPTPTSGDTFHAGAAFYDTTANCLKVHNGTSFVCSAAGGVATINGISGAVVLAGTTSQVVITPGGSTLTFSLPQSIATTSSPTFAAVTATTLFNSAATGTNTAFQANGGTFSVNGQGDLSTAGVIATSSGVNVTTTTANNSIQTTGGFKGRRYQISHPNSAIMEFQTAAGGSGYNIQRSLSPSDAQQFMIYNAQNGRYLLFADTSDNVGVNTSAPSHTFEVNGTTQTTNLIVTGTCTGCGGGGGGVTSLNTLTGALNIVPANGLVLTPSGTSLNLTCPTCMQTNTVQTITGQKTFNTSGGNIIFDNGSGATTQMLGGGIQLYSGATAVVSMMNLFGTGYLALTTNTGTNIFTVSATGIYVGAGSAVGKTGSCSGAPTSVINGLIITC